MNIIEVNNLTKVYSGSFKKNNVTALKNFSLGVESGLVYGLLGPNGAGKTTLIKILLGITFATQGDCRLFGKDIKDYRLKKDVGYLPENHRFPNYLTAEEVMKYFAALGGYENKDIGKRIDELLYLVRMDKWKKVKIKKFSKGMMQRLGLAQAMLHDPKMIFLDEPTDGVDPVGRKEIRDIIAGLKSEGKTIFLNSHLLSEVELISDRVAILNRGELIREGTVEDLTTTKETYKFSLDRAIPETDLGDKLQEFNITLNEKGDYSAVVGNPETLNKLIDKLRAEQYNIISITPQKNTLEDMFISLINKSEKN